MALITCPECGKQISDKAQHCVSCGLTINAPKQQANYQRNYASTQIRNERYKNEGQGSATASLILGLFALIAWIIPLFGFPICIAGIIAGSVSLSKSNSGNAIAGLVLSILGLTATIINSFVGAVVWSQYFSTHFN